MAEVTAVDLREFLRRVDLDIAQRQRHGWPVPESLRRLRMRLTCALADDGQEDPCHKPQFESVRQRAQRLGISERTARRHAVRDGLGRKLGSEWLFEVEDQ